MITRKAGLSTTLAISAIFLAALTASATKYDYSVPYICQLDYAGAPHYIGNSACGPTSITMLLRYYFPNSDIDVPEVYHSGIQGCSGIRGYQYWGPAVGYKNVSFASGDPGTSIVDASYRQYYTGDYSGLRSRESAAQYLNLLWGGESIAYKPAFADIIAEIKQRPFVMNIKTTFTKGHYIVIRGYDDNNTSTIDDDKFYINDPYPWAGQPSGNNRELSYYTLSDWYGGGILTFNPALISQQQQYTVLVDNGNVELDDISDEEWWEYYGAYGNGGDWYYPKKSGHWAKWKPNLPIAGKYDVHVVLHKDNNQSNVSYTVYDKAGNELKSITINQKGSGWLDVSLGIFALDNGSYVKVNNVPELCNVDAIRFEYAGPVTPTLTKPLDIILDIDRSGSMRGQKIIDAKEAAKMFVGLLEEQDQVGLVSFSTTATLDLHLTPDFEAAKNVIADYSASGNTNMGDALIESINELKTNGRSDVIRSIIYFTDGKNNTRYTNAQILDEIIPLAVEAGIFIYTLGYGSGVNEAFLRQIAEATRGKYYFAPDSAALRKIYVELSQEAKGIKKVAEFVGSVAQGGTRRHTFLVETAIRFLRLFLLWPGSDLDLRVLDPSGNLVAPGPKVIYSGNAAFPEYYEIHDPLPGNWTIEVYGKDVTDTTEEYTVMVFQPAALMQVRPTSCQINYPTSKTTTFTVSEVAGMVDLKNVVVTASELTAIQTTSTTTEVIVQSDLREREELQPVSSQAQSIPASSFSFTPNNFTIPAGGSRDVTATLSVPAGTPLGDYSGTINVNSSDGTAQISVMVKVAAEPSQPEGAFLTDKDTVTVPEGGTTRLGVKLSNEPQGTTRARVSWISGDSSIMVKGNANLTFDKNNWNTYQYVTLAAARDADSENGTAIIRVHRIAGDPIPYKDVTAIEQDQPGNCATFPAGWNLLSIPVEPDDPSPKTVFDEVSPLHLYTYNGTDYDSFKSGRLTTVKALYGYWLLLDRTTRVCVDGTVLTGNQSLQLGKTGWQMIGVPYPVTWGSPGPPPPPPDTAALDFPTSFSPMVQTPSGSITVTKGTQTTTLAAAVTAGWIYDTIWEYNTTSGKYTSATLSGGKILNPWSGYWILTYENNLKLNFSETGGAPGLPPPPPAGMRTGLRVPASPPPPPTLPGTFSVEDSLEFTNIPNPITDVSTTTFAVTGSTAAFVETIKVQIFDLSGRLVYESGEIPGTSLDWHTDNDYGELLANGVYLYRMYAKIDGEWIESEVKKLAILR